MRWRDARNSSAWVRRSAARRTFPSAGPAWAARSASNACSVRVSGSLSRTPPSVYQRCFDGGKFTMPRARYPASSPLRSSRTGRNASAFAADASATSVGEARAGSTSSRAGCPDVNVNVAQSSEVVARTGCRAERVGTRYSRPRSDASAMTMRIGATWHAATRWVGAPWRSRGSSRSTDARRSASSDSGSSGASVRITDSESRSTHASRIT